MILNLFHNNILCYNNNSRCSCDDCNGLGLVVVRLMDMVWKGRIVSFVRNVRGSNVFNVKSCYVIVAVSGFILLNNIVGVSYLCQVGWGVGVVWCC